MRTARRAKRPGSRVRRSGDPPIKQLDGSGWGRSRRSGNTAGSWHPPALPPGSQPGPETRRPGARGLERGRWRPWWTCLFRNAALVRPDPTRVVPARDRTMLAVLRREFTSASAAVDPFSSVLYSQRQQKKTRWRCSAAIYTRCYRWTRGRPHSSVTPRVARTGRVLGVGGHPPFIVKGMGPGGRHENRREINPSLLSEWTSGVY